MAAIDTSSSNVSPIEAATRVHNLVYLGYVSVLVLAAFFTWFAWKTGNKVQDAIRADANARVAEALSKAEQAKADASNADERAAKANEGAAKANEEAGRANESAARANERAATLETQAAGAAKEVALLQKAATNAKAVQQRVEIELDKQRERTAIAERSLLELQERLKPRVLDAKQSAAFVAALNKLQNGTINIGYTAFSGDEGSNFTRQLIALFKAAGWTIKNDASVTLHMDLTAMGVGILVPGPAGTDTSKIPPPGQITLTPTLVTLRSAFKSVGIDVQFISWFPVQDDIVEVLIGTKPQP